MRMKMRPRYYCDHCGRGSGSASFIRRHEPTCTANPSRKCRMCESMPDADRQARRAAILTAPGNSQEAWKAKMRELREECDGCPCCILTAIRQSKVQADACGPDPDGYPDTSSMYWPDSNGADAMLGFSFKVEKAEWLQARANEGY